MTRRNVHFVAVVTVSLATIGCKTPARSPDRLGPGLEFTQYTPARQPTAFLLPDDSEPGACREQYEPCEADMIFLNSGSAGKQVAFFVAASGGLYYLPTHVGVVVRDAGGRLALLQALDPLFKDFRSKEFYEDHGLRDGEVNLTCNFMAYLKDYVTEYQDARAKVWVRRHRGTERHPRMLPPTQSRDLTEWALHQRRKPYGLPKLALPITGLPTRFLNAFPTQTEADSWHCSGLVAASLIRMDYYGPFDIRPAFTDPEDLFTDTLLDLSVYWECPRRLEFAN